MFLDRYFLKVFVGIIWVLEGAELSYRGPHDSEWGVREQELPVEQHPGMLSLRSSSIMYKCPL